MKIRSEKTKRGRNWIHWIFLLMEGAALLFLLPPQRAWAGEAALVREDSSLKTGWNWIDGRWHYLDGETGTWTERPVINVENAPYLLENVMIREGLYQNEENKMEYRVIYDTVDTVSLSVGWQEKPEEFHGINLFEMDKKKGTVRSTVTKEQYQVY